jgi:CHAD domain-containing protein
MHHSRKTADGQGADADGPAGPEVKPDDPAASAVRATLAVGLHWLHVNEGPARAGDTEGVHHLRTTTRRLRSALGLFRDLTEPAWADALADELKWLAGLIGAVRDLDVLTGRLRAGADEEGTSGSLGPLFDALAARHAAASGALRDALGGERYAALSARLAESPSAVPLGDDAWEPCRDALPPLVDAAWKRLKRAGRALGRDDPDEDFHEVRKRAKRARYAAEAVGGALEPGPSAAAHRFAGRARDVQDVLGEHQDAVVAASLVREQAAAHPDLGPFNLASGLLLARESRAAADSRDRFFDAWDDLDRKKLVRWLKP